MNEQVLDNCECGESAIDFDEELRKLIARKRTDPDISFLEEKIGLVSEAYQSGVGVAGIWRLLKETGFSGGKDKLKNFLEAKGVKKKGKGKAPEKPKRIIQGETKAKKEIMGTEMQGQVPGKEVEAENRQAVEGVFSETRNGRAENSETIIESGEFTVNTDDRV